MVLQHFPSLLIVMLVYSSSVDLLWHHRIKISKIMNINKYWHILYLYYVKYNNSIVVYASLYSRLHKVGIIS